MDDGWAESWVRRTTGKMFESQGNARYDILFAASSVLRYRRFVMDEGTAKSPRIGPHPNPLSRWERGISTVDGRLFATASWLRVKTLL